MMTESDLVSPTSTSAPHELSPGRMEEKTSYRKSNKPMMEKKRRARINSCLGQLKSLVLQAMKKDNSQYSKLEKADILELTVKHLKNVQRYQVSSSLTQTPDAISKYRAGFNECANEVIRYLGQSHGVNDEARSRILSHLASILTPINTLPLQQAHHHTPILPAPSSSVVAASQQQQLQQQLQQQHHFHLQQQQQQHQQHAAYLSAASQGLTLDSNNNNSSSNNNNNNNSSNINSKSIKLETSSYATHSSAVVKSVGREATAMNLATPTPDVTSANSASPTAFQAPIVSGVTAAPPGGLQLPCIATAAMATGTQFQLVPSALPSGQLALVLAPQHVSALNMGVYTQQQQQQQQQQAAAATRTPLLHDAAQSLPPPPPPPPAPHSQNQKVTTAGTRIPLLHDTTSTMHRLHQHHHHQQQHHQQQQQQQQQHPHSSVLEDGKNRLPSSLRNESPMSLVTKHPRSPKLTGTPPTTTAVQPSPLQHQEVSQGGGQGERSAAVEQSTAARATVTTSPNHVTSHQASSASSRDSGKKTETDMDTDDNDNSNIHRNIINKNTTANNNNSNNNNNNNKNNANNNVMRGTTKENDPMWRPW